MRVIVSESPHRPSHCLCLSFSGAKSSKTFKPKKNIPEGTHRHDLMKYAAATLGSGNLRLAVQLPDGEDLNEWIAVNSEAMGTALERGHFNLIMGLRGSTLSGLGIPVFVRLWVSRCPVNVDAD